MEEDSAGEGYHLARTGWLESELPASERVLRMLHAVFQESVGDVLDQSHGGVKLPLFVALPQAIGPHAWTTLELPHAGRWSEIQRLPVGHAAGLVGLEMDLQQLQHAAGGLACVAGVDVRSSPDAIAALAKEGRLHTESHPWGLVPGEGAGALLLATESMRRQLKLQSLGTVIGLGIDDEDAYRRGVPCIGSGLSRACHAALGMIAGAAQVEEIYCDLNGERARADEWGFTAPRISRQCQDVSHFVAPATSWGDLGSATSILLTQLALTELTALDASGQVALVWSASEAGQRAAALIQSPNEAPVTQHKHIPNRSSEEQHFDAGIIDELRADASFLFEQRARRRSDLELEPAADQLGAALEASEQRLELQIRGLVAVSSLSRKVCQSPATCAGDVYVATRVLAEGERNAGLRVFIEQLELDTEDVREPLEAALAHSARHLSAEVIEDLSALDRRLEVHLAAETGHMPKASWLELARGGPHQLGLTFPAALVRLNVAPDCLRLLSPWLACEEPNQRLAAMTALVRLDQTQARDFLRLCAPSASVLMARVLSATPEDIGDLEQQLIDWPDAGGSALMLGMLGTQRASLELLRRLPDVPSAGAAALHLVTGRPLFETGIVEDRVPDDQLTHEELTLRHAGDTSVGVERNAIRRFARGPEPWRQVLDELFVGQSATERLRLGSRLSRASLVEATQHPLVAPSLQNLMREELALRHGVSLPQRRDWRVHEWREACRILLARGDDGN